MCFRLLFVLLIIGVTASAQITTSPFPMADPAFNEENPVLSPDGNTLYFTITNHPSNIGGRKDPGDIWYSTRQGDNWSTPVHGGSLINDRAYNAVAGLNFRGDQLFLHGHYDPNNGVARTQGISIAVLNGAGWSRPANISIPYFLNKSSFISGTVTDDGSVFVFSAETYGSHGVEDIYVCFNKSGSWTEPKNLGQVVNTTFQELSPSLSVDQMTLYFSSNGRKGYGSFDVYSSTRLDDSWTNWSPPVNMGQTINTSGRDLYFRPHRLGTGIYTTTRSSDQYGDIGFWKQQETTPSDLVVKLPTPVDTVVELTQVSPPVIAPSNTIKVRGRITNAKTGEPINADIVLTAAATSARTTSSQSGFLVEVEPSNQYTVTIEAKGYISAMEKLDVRQYSSRELEMNFALQPVAVGTTVNLKNVLFAQAKTEILPESFPELDLVVNFLQTNPNVRIELAGHTDNRGVHEDNVKLSLQRVNKVKAYLVGKGIESKRISGKGYGGTKPIASNDTEESRKMNRRVEFTIKRF